MDTGCDRLVSVSTSSDSPPIPTTGILVHIRAFEIISSGRCVEGWPIRVIHLYIFMYRVSFVFYVQYSSIIAGNEIYHTLASYKQYWTIRVSFFVASNMQSATFATKKVSLKFNDPPKTGKVLHIGLTLLRTISRTCSVVRCQKRDSITRKQGARGSHPFQHPLPIQASIYDKYSGSMKITTHLDPIRRRKTASGIDWLNRWTYRVFNGLSRRVFMINTQAQWKLLHTWFT